MRGSIEDKRNLTPAAAVRGGGGGGGEAGGPGGSAGKRGDACLAEIQRLEKNRANRRNRMEKARYELAPFVLSVAQPTRFTIE